MPQILKEQLRTRILDSARSEFVRRGFQQASMRDIAASAGTTVGNLYRYYPGKEEILRALTEEPLKEIASMIARLSRQQVRLFGEQIELDLKAEEIYGVMDALADAIVPIFRRYPEECLILMMQSQLNEQITGWFSRLVDVLMRRHVSDGRESHILSRGYAVALFSGFREIFVSSGDDDSRLSGSIKNYLRGFVSALSYGFEERKQDHELY